MCYGKNPIISALLKYLPTHRMFGGGKMKKLYAALLVVALSAVAFATKPMPDIASYPYNGNYPDIVVLKGVAVKGEKVFSAVFLGIEQENDNYKHIYLIIDGKAHELELDSKSLDKGTGTAILTFKGDEKLTLVVRESYTAAGMYGEYLLSMTAANQYSIARPYTGPMAEKAAVTTSEKAAEEIIKETIEKK